MGPPQYAGQYPILPVRRAVPPAYTVGLLRELHNPLGCRAEKPRESGQEAALVTIFKTRRSGRLRIV